MGSVTGNIEIEGIILMARKKGQVNNILITLVLLVALGVGIVFLYDTFAGGDEVVEQTALPTEQVVQVGDTQTVELRAFQDGLKLDTRTQLALTYLVHRNGVRVDDGTLSASAGTDFVGAYNARYEWAVYDDNGSGDDYYLTEGSFTALPAEDFELSAWQEASSSDITITILENDGTVNDGTIVMGAGSDKVVQAQIELNNLNKRYAHMGACVDYDEGNFSDVSIIGATVDSSESEPRRLDGNEQCFDLGKSLPTADSEAITTYQIALSADGSENPVQNVSFTLYDQTKFIDPANNLPSADVAPEDSDRNDVGASDISFSINVQ